MKHVILILSALLISIHSGYCQNNEVIIEGQILGYDGFSAIWYTLSSSNHRTDFIPLKVDREGRFLIKKSITKTQFFHLHYYNANETDSSYHCKLLVQPNKNYFFTSVMSSQN
jgi:hypothetical protein